MRLTRVRIRGFKSFADQTELLFERGVGVIVGPNGSGKSNIAEALRWAMASASPSDFRVASGIDVLFNGAEGRAAAGLAEVELVLEDEGGVSPGGRPELSIMRRLSRDGESTYLINRVPVRRLDVQEVLADLGLGRDSHAVIAQNEVDHVLLSRPEERRGLIEEVAGLGKYKRRRVRARQKLSRVEKNLEEARARHADLQGRLRPLALQASAAERAAALETELGTLRLQLIASAIVQTRRDRGARAQDVETARGDQDRLDAAAAALVARREAAEAALGALVAEQEQASRVVQRLDAGVERLAERTQALVERRELVAVDAERLGRRAERLLDDAANASSAAASLEMDVERERAALAAEDDGADLEQRLIAANERAKAALDAALEARRAQAEHEGRLARAQAEATEGQQRAAAAQARVAELREGEAGRTQARTIAEAAVEVTERTAAEARTALAGAERADEAARGAAEVARAAEAEALATAATARSIAAEARARVEEAAQRDTRDSGLSAALGRLRDRGVAVVGDHLEADEGYERALAAVLAWRAAEAVASEASEAISVLADDALEGAALLCLDRLSRREAEGPGRALDQHVRCADDTYRHLIDGVLVVDTPGDLVAVRRGIAVLRDGRGFDADRGMAFRAGDAAERALRRRRDHDRARADLAEAEVTEATASATLIERQAARETAEQHEMSVRTELERIRGAVAAAEQAIGEALRDRDRRMREDESASERLHAADQEFEQASTRARSAVDEAEALATGLAELHARVAARTAEHEQADLERLEVQAAAADRRGRRAGSEERIERTRVEAERLRAQAVDQERQAAAARRAATDLTGIAAHLPAALAALESAASAIERFRGPARERTRAGEARVAELGAELRACAEEDARVGGERREVAARAAALAVEVERSDERLRELDERRRELLERREDLSYVEPAEPLAADEQGALEQRVDRIERRIVQLGAVNPLAKEAYEEAKAEVTEIGEQITDLEASVVELRRLVRELGREIQSRFDATYGAVEQGFAEVIDTLFPGGSGRLRLVEPAEVVAIGGEAGEADPEADAADAVAAAESVETEEPEPGVELEVQPAGKRIRSLTHLSGGEKSMAALAFTFALMLARPSPFYVLDEVDAALDEANIDRFLGLLERFRDRAQFIVITHQAGTMEAGDALYGVSMPGNGVSQVISRRLPREGHSPADRLAAPIAS